MSRTKARVAARTASLRSMYVGQTTIILMAGLLIALAS
jgi:hypothetical protein